MSSKNKISMSLCEVSENGVLIGYAHEITVHYLWKNDTNMRSTSVFKTKKEAIEDGNKFKIEVEKWKN